MKSLLTLATLLMGTVLFEDHQINHIRADLTAPVQWGQSKVERVKVGYKITMMEARQDMQAIRYQWQRLTLPTS